MRIAVKPDLYGKRKASDGDRAWIDRMRNSIDL